LWDTISSKSYTESHVQTAPNRVMLREKILSFQTVQFFYIN
jgi:hypothetical protein